MTVSVAWLLKDKPWRKLASLRHDPLLITLVTIDIILIALHLARAVAKHKGWMSGVLDHDILAIDLEHSYGEFFQYAKAATAAALLGWTFVLTGARIFAALGLIFAAIMLDDALQIHERLGSWFAGPETPSQAPAIVSDVAELAFLAGFGAIAFVLLALWVRATRVEHLRTAGLFVVPFAAFGFFGGAIDLLHAAVGKAFFGANIILSTVEDGGEMLAISLACALARMVYAAEAAALARGLETPSG